MASRRGSSCSAPASVPGGAAGSHSLHSPGAASAGAAPPAPSACRLQVVRAVVLAPARDAGYCCLAYDAAPLVRVARKCQPRLVQSSWSGAAVSFELI